MEPIDHPLFSPVRDALLKAGWSNEPRHRFARAGVEYFVFCEALAVAPQTWEKVIRAFLAEAILQSRAATSPSTTGTPLVVVIAPSVTNSMDERVAAFVRRVAPGTAWMLLDEQGRVYPHAPGLEFLERRVPVTERPRRAHATTNLFTDTHQWLLKVLLAPAFPERLLAAPRSRPIRNASVLAEVAEVSVPAAARFVALLDGQGHLDRSRGELRVVMAARLFERWRAAVSKEPRELRLRPMRGDLSADELRTLLMVMTAQQAPRRVALGLFSACDALGLGVVRGGPAHLYVSDPDAAWLEGAGLVPAGSGEPAAITVRVPRWPRSLFRAAVPTDRGTATDVIQCWLDVSQHPARGLEQADQLWRKGIAPSIERAA